MIKKAIIWLSEATLTTLILLMMIVFLIIAGATDILGEILGDDDECE